LREIIGDLVGSVVLDQTLNLEIDPARASDISAEERASRINVLKHKVSLFADRIMCPESRQRMPREVRAIAGYTSAYAKIYMPEKNPRPLIGGFVMLRFISPGVVTPESFDLLPPGMTPDLRSRRNLIMIAKLLQNMSNAIPFAQSGKEEHMVPFDEFLTPYFDKMGEFLEDIARDPLAQGDIPEWNDFVTKDITVAEIRDAMPRINLQNSFFLHRLVDTYKAKFIPTLQNAVPGAVEMDIVKLIDDLGPPPSRAKARPKPGGTATADGPFLYAGPASKKDLPVIYMIVARVPMTMFDNVPALLQHVVKFVTDSIGPDRQYALVIDMSWASAAELSDKFVSATKQIFNMGSLISRQERKRLREIHLVHPTVLNKVILFFIRSITSKKLEQKIFEHHHWKSLGDHVAEGNIQLPEVSKQFTTKSYRIIKVNAKGKQQERLLKFTPNSILNLDPKGSTLQNEKLLTDIQEIVCPTSESDDLIIRFTSESVERDASKKGRFGLRSSSRADLEVRKCANSFTADCFSSQLTIQLPIVDVCQPGDREKILEDFFATVFSAATTTVALQYKVVKVNEAGKKQDRIFKLTLDSVLNLDGSKIRTELAFAGFELIKKDPHNKKYIVIKMKNQPKERLIITNNDTERDLLWKLLSDAVNNAQSIASSEENLLRTQATAVYRD
jgi:hypothetical protein